jgi:MvdC family ATP-grasp ribosomal peptide maturase
MRRSSNVVLLLTHSGDYFTIDRVIAALSKRGAQPFRFDTDLFPTEVQISSHLSNFGLSYHLQVNGQLLDTQQVRAVWMRRIWAPQFSPSLDLRYREACTRESFAALEGFLDSLEQANWIDPLPNITQAENKLKQLRLASSVGLAIPPTLVSNQPESVRQFFKILQNDGNNMIAKLLTPLSASMTGSGFFLYTSRVTDLSALESLCHSPMVFQAEIPKKRELRAIAVQDQLFVGALDASHYADKTVDWRSAEPDACVWQPAELPVPVSNRLRAVLAQLNLSFAAFDLIETPEGEYVFLEVNPTGEWGMLERDLNYPIADTIANALLNPV